MGKTSALTVNSSGFSAITTLSNCKGVAVNEDAGVASWPTTDFLVCQALADTPRRMKAGSAYKFETQHFWQAGTVVGYVKAVTGSTTFAQDESSA
jgi:hypothetical protein